MKKMIMLCCLFLMAMMTMQVHAQSSCTYTVQMHDSYGDGWNGGAALTVLQGSQQVQTFTLPSGANRTATFTVTDGVAYKLQWTKGSYDSEISFEVLDAMGSIVYSTTDASVLGSSIYEGQTIIFSTFTANCSGCFPRTVTLADVDNQSATINWPSAPSNEYHVGIAMANAVPDTANPMLVSDTFYTFINLNASTEYTAYLRVVCDVATNSYSPWKTVNFNTLGDIAQLPYVCDFEDATENAQWTFVNGSNTNAWYIGNAVNNGGNTSLYISDDGGLTNHYNPDEYVENAVWAYRDINFGQDVSEYILSFDFLGMAEFGYDYVKVFVGSPREPNGNNTPAEATLLATLFNESAWGTHTYTINGSHTGVQRLYFLWYNDHISGEQPPAAIDNISIEGVNCGAPYELAIDTTTSSSITFHFTPASSDNNSWEAAIALAGQDFDDAQVVSINSTTYTFTGLSSSSCYRIRVRTNCEEDEYSTWSNSIEGRTDCGVVTALPFSENFNTNFGRNDTNYMPCWTRINNYDEIGRPHILDGSLYFYAGPSSHNIAVTPAFASSINVRNLVATFSYKGYYVSDQLIVGVMSDPTDTTTFVPVDTVAVDISNPEQFVQKIVYFNNYTGNGHYVAFKNKYTIRGTSSYIDNLVINQMGTCARPTNVVVNGITDTTVNVDWTTYSDESIWNVMVVPAGAAMDTAGIVKQADAHPFVFGGLEANTAYDVYVQADCGDGDLSEWSLSTTFRTACEALTIFPYVENFESYQAHERPDCWSFPIPYGENPVVMGTEAYSGTKSLRMGATNNTFTTAVTPCIGEDLHQMKLKFKMKLESLGESGAIEVGVMSDPNIISTFEFVRSVQPTSTDWTEYVINLNTTTLSGPNRYVAFRQYSVYTNAYIYIDDVELTLLSGCGMPENLSVSNLTNSSVEITWTDEGENQWETYFFSDDETPDFIQTDVISTNSYGLSDLSANTLYHFYVRTVCSNGEGYGDWAHIDFMTLDTYPASTPYFCDFSEADENAEWRMVTGFGPNQWYIGQPTGMTDSVLFISADGVSSDYNINSASTAWAYRNITFGAGAEFELSFKWKGVGEYQLDFMKVYVGDPTLPFNGEMSVPTGATQVGEFFHDASTWQRFTHVFDDSYSGTTKRIFFMWHNDFAYGDNPAMMIDSIQIMVSECGKPTNLTADNITATQAVINFTPAASSGVQWQYVVCPAGGSPYAQAPVEVNNTSITLSGLTPATSYDVYVRTVCLDGGYSSWSNKVTFLTECVMVDVLPYTETFDTYSTSYPTCWSRLSTCESGTFPLLSSINFSAPSSLYFVADSATVTIAATPEFGASIQMNTLQVEFKYRSAASKMVVGVMTDPADANTFVAIDTVTASNNAWTNAVVYLSAYTGAGKYIAFKMGSDVTNFGYIDNVVVSEAPDCLPASNVTATNITSNSAVITWTPAGTATSWTVEYGPVGFVHGQGTSVVAYNNNIALNGLTPVTTYDVYVKSMCSATSESPWSYVYTFTTECEAYTLPFSENFDALTEGVPTCWSNEEGTTANEGYRWNHYAEGYSGAGMRFNSYYNPTNATNLLTTPVITLPASAHPFLTFWCKNPTGGEFNVLISTDNGETFNTTLMTGLMGITEWEERMINLTNYAGQDVMIAFSGKSNYGSGDAYLYLDEVVVFDSIMPVPPCDAPTNLTATDKTVSSVVLNWNQTDATVNAWVVSYKKSTDNTWTNVNVSSKPYTLNGLEYNTEYNVKVAASCDGTISDYSSVVTFKTAGDGVSDYDMNSVNVYPNPTSGQLTIDNSGMMINRVEVYDVYGKLLNMVEVNDVQATMDASNYAVGTYFVRIYTEGGMITKRIVKR